jgi:thymidine phosphorylase
VLEAVHTLQGRGPKDTEELSLALAGAMLVLAGAASSREEGLRRVEKALRSGEGLEMFRRFVAAQGGIPSVADDPEGVLALAPSRWDLVAPETGWLDRIDARKVGVAMRLLGGGRLHKDDAIRPGVAAEVLVRPGGAVETGSPVLRLHYDDEARLAEAKDALRDALVIVEEQPPRRSVVLEAVD